MERAMDNELSHLYRIEYDDGIVQTFDIRLHALTLDNNLDSGTAPDWARRGAFGCVNPSCLLRPDETCPFARIVHYLLTLFDNVRSTQMVEASVRTPHRTTTKRVAIQAVVGSMAGILMATCGCPVLARFKPMVRFHLPFASLEETEYRAFTMYALAQFLRDRRHLSRDDGLDGLRRFYSEVQALNRLAAAKISALQKMDATINGLVILDTFASSVTFSLDDNDLDHMEHIFSDWLK